MYIAARRFRTNHMRNAELSGGVLVLSKSLSDEPILIPFADRRQAGKKLAAKLTRYANRPDVLVLALPRGGVPVAYEIALSLNAPLDVFVVRKLGVPDDEELAMGAIASGGVRVINADVMSRRFQFPKSVIDEVAAREQKELERRERLYRRRPAYARCSRAHGDLDR